MKKKHLLLMIFFLLTPKTFTMKKKSTNLYKIILNKKKSKLNKNRLKYKWQFHRYKTTNTFFLNIKYKKIIKLEKNPIPKITDGNIDITFSGCKFWNKNKFNPQKEKIKLWIIKEKNFEHKYKSKTWTKKIIKKKDHFLELSEAEKSNFSFVILFGEETIIELAKKINKKMKAFPHSSIYDYRFKLKDYSPNWKNIFNTINEKHKFSSTDNNQQDPLNQEKPNIRKRKTDFFITIEKNDFIKNPSEYEWH